ncbi:Eco57I restriction-modification methylase domain-containing protein, partial [Psychrobacter sp.]|uniref:Eco57I restriction-modification methylase domain-containing protein n=1 Tax=Psychrobacter sp. TaxID=56811 RepID=UPI002FDB966E
MSLDKKLFSIASSAVEKQQKARDARNPVSKGLDIATNKSYANEDKKVAAAALRQWENNTWKPKVEAKLKQEIKKRAPHLKPGTKAYQQTYDSLFNKNYKDLQAAKASAQQQIGTLRKPKQSQRQLDNEYRQNESIRNNTVGLQAAAHTARDTGEAVSGALATGASRTLRYPLQFAADIGENDDGGIFDRGAKALERHEDNLQQVYPAYSDIQQNGNFGQKLALSAVEQIPTLAASFGTAGAAAKGVQLLGAGAKTAAAVSYGTAAATMYPQAYGDGNDSTKQELENATPQQLATAVRSKDIYKGHFDKNIKAGMSEDEAYQKARDQTISSIAEESGDAVGLATLALSMLAPGVGSFTANRYAGGAVSKWGQKVFNTLAVKADAGKVARVAIPAAVGTGIVGLNVAEEALQEGYTDYKAQQAAVDVGVKNKIDTAQTKEAMLMGGILGGAMGGGVYIGTRNSKLHQAQDDLKTAQQAYAEVAGQIPQLQQQIEDVSPRSPQGQALTAQLEETRSVLDAMAAEAEKASIPRTSLARRAPRIDPTNSAASDFDGQVEGATELSEQDFENALNPDGTPAPQSPVVQPMSEAELDAQDAQLAELIAEQAALDEAIEDGSNEKPLEESIAAAQSWYDSKRGEGKQGLAGVVSRAAATEQDAAFAQQQEGIKGTTTSINDYIASERAKQQQIEVQLQQEAQAATTDAEKQAVAQKIEQREINRAKEDELLSSREQLAQPYENESFDTTVIAADGAPFNLARFWDSNMPAAAKAKAIADAFGGQVEQNVAKADWQSMPEGVQKELHQWFTERLDGVRQSREGATEQTSEQVAAPAVEQPQEVAPTVNGLTMPVQQPVVEQAPIAPVEEQTPTAPAEVEQVAEIDSTPAATQLTDENPVINIPAPTQSKTVAPKDREGLAEYFAKKLDAQGRIYSQEETENAIREEMNVEFDFNNPVAYDAMESGETYSQFAKEVLGKRKVDLTDRKSKQTDIASTDDKGIYKSKPAAKAAIKKQKLDPDSVTIKQVKGGGFEIVPNAPAKPSYAQAQEQAATELSMTLDENGEYGGTDAEFEAFAKRVDEIQGRSLSNSTPTPRQNTTAPNNDAAIGKDGLAKWFGSNDKAQAFIAKKGLTDTHEVVSAGKSRFEIQPKAQTTGATNQTSTPIDVTSENGSSDTQELTATSEQSAPAKRAEAKKAATDKSQNDVSTTEAKSRFADNKLFTEDKVAAARALLKSKMGQLNSGFDPEMAIAGMTLAGAYIESGVRKFGDYAKLMIEDFGDNIKPQLLSFWEGARNWDGLDTEGMTSVADSKREYDQLKAETITTDELSENDDDTGTSNQDDRQRADGELSTAVQADAESRNTGRSQAEPTSDVSDIDGRGARPDTIESDGDSRSAAARQRTDADDSDGRADSTQSNDGAVKDADATPTVKAKNHVVSPADSNEKLSWQKVAERNVSIIELIKQLDSEGRQATANEQALLAQYAGWGASEIANGIFPNPDTGKYKSDSWQALGEKLKSLLTKSEYDTAMRTTQYAHYTPPVLVEGIYKALENFGFKGGQVLEPASGIGVFNGLMPKKMADSSAYVGLELDPITGRIAQHLYPQSTMKIDDYIKAKLPDDHFDVAVGNPPFAGISVSYKGAGKNSAKQSMQLHDYFFAKTLDKLKPGGVMAFVTSKGTMDKKGSSVRELLAEQADLIGAIRLPQTAFKENAGTEVVTDIIFLRKRLEGEQPSDTAWANVKTIQASGKPTAINEYFVNNPDMVLGEHAITSGRFGDTYTVTPNKGDFASQVNQAIDKLPKDVFNPQRGSKAEAIKVTGLDYDAASAANKEGGVYLKGGKLMRVVDGVGKPLTQRYGTNGKAIDLSAKDIAFMTDYVGVRDALKQAQRDQLNDSDTWEDSLAALNSTYDAFVKKHGPLMAHTVSERENDDGSVTVTKRFKNKQRLFLDVEGVLASALENVIDDGKGTVVKGSFFEGRSLRKPKAPTITSTQDALVYTLDEKGVLDIDRIAQVTNQSREQVITELGDQIYSDPTTNQWDLAETYLSGNVVEKLATAKAAAKNNSTYNRNVKALEAVQPAPIAPNDISSNMGAAWIPGSAIKEFSEEVLGAKIDAEYSSAVGLWDVSGNSRSSDYATADRSTVQLVESILNSRKISITRKSADGSTFTDSVATELANEVARKIKTEFKKWLWSDDTRTQELADYYNKTYNNIVPPTFNGDHLTLAGMSNKIQLRAPQKRGIYRVIRQGDVYLNHAVGAGKTFTMIAAA